MNSSPPEGPTTEVRISTRGSGAQGHARTVPGGSTAPQVPKFRQERIWQLTLESWGLFLSDGRPGSVGSDSWLSSPWLCTPLPEDRRAAGKHCGPATPSSAPFPPLDTEA